MHKQIVKHINWKPRRRRGKLCALSGICGATGCAGRHASCGAQKTSCQGSFCLGWPAGEAIKLTRITGRCNAQTRTHTHEPTNRRTHKHTHSDKVPACQPASPQFSENDEKSQFFIVSPWGTSQGRTIIHNAPATIDGSASCGLPQGHRQAEAKPPLAAVVPVASGEGIGSGLCSSESRTAKN